jgi:hypothetical protein
MLSPIRSSGCPGVSRKGGSGSTKIVVDSGCIFISRADEDGRVSSHEPMNNILPLLSGMIAKVKVPILYNGTKRQPDYQGQMQSPKPVKEHQPFLPDGARSGPTIQPVIHPSVSPE